MGNLVGSAAMLVALPAAATAGGAWGAATALFALGLFQSPFVPAQVPPRPRPCRGHLRTLWDQYQPSRFLSPKLSKFNHDTPARHRRALVAFASSVNVAASAGQSQLKRAWTPSGPEKAMALVRIRPE